MVGFPLTSLQARQQLKINKFIDKHVSKFQIDNENYHVEKIRLAVLQHGWLFSQQQQLMNEWWRRVVPLL